ncbi:MAG: hypothetical protein ABEJ56_01495 [Candidatus Nanohaloarchaea archaeon]
MNFSTDEIKLTKERLKSMPEHLELSIGGHGSFNKEELINEVEKQSEVGEMATRRELNALRKFKEVK